MLQSQRVTTDMARLMIQLQRAETSQRGYSAERQSEFLGLYNDSLGRIYPILETITESAKNNGRAGAELLNLRSLIEAKIAEMDANRRPRIEPA